MGSSELRPDHCRSAMASLRRIHLPLLFLSLCQASANTIIGADGKEYHPKRHHHKHHHKGKTSSHLDATQSFPVPHAGTVQFSLDTPAVHHHHGTSHRGGGGISSEPALQHVTAPVEHHSDL